MYLHLLRALGAFVLMSFFATLLGAKTPPEYPRLSDNTAASQNLEVRKVLSGDVDGIFAIPRTHQLVAAAGGYLWKFSAQGELLDTLRKPGGLSTSGIAFSPLYYTDWVFTGDKQRKTYGPPVDGNTLSAAALWAVLDKADVVEFGKTDTTAWAYVWKAGQAYILNINSNRKQVDTYCTQRTHSAEKLRLDATCLDNYKTRPQAWAEVEPESFTDFDGTPPRVKVAGFERRKFHLEEGLSGQAFGLTLGAALKLAGYPGSLPGRYWFGDALTQLRVGQEVIKFRTFIPKEDGDYRYFYNTRWWEPAPGVAGVSPWFSVHMRTYMERAGEEGLLRYYEKDIGLYVARPKGTGQPAATQGPMPEWRPVFEGPATRNAAVTGMIEFGAQTPAQQSALAPMHYWLRDPEPSKRYPEMPPTVEVRAQWPNLRQLPTALQVQWRGTRDDEATVLRVELDADEAAIVFNTLRTNKVQTEPLQLALLVPELRGTLDGMQVQLRSGSTKLPLTKTRFRYVVKPPVEKVSDHALRGVLQTATAAAKVPGAAGLPAFLKQAQTFAQDKEHAEALAPNVTAAYAELINDYNAQRDFKAGAALVRHYLTQIHPHIGHYSSDSGQPYNITVIASQTLAIAAWLAPQDKDLVPAVIAKLLGPDFEPAKQTNGTLMYNLACHYAVSSDKPHMLQSITAARRLGKPPSQFMADTDFTQYLKDAEFLKAAEQQP
jgi:hypothetical protein